MGQPAVMTLPGTASLDHSAEARKTRRGHCTGWSLPPPPQLGRAAGERQGGASLCIPRVRMARSQRQPCHRPIAQRWETPGGSIRATVPADLLGSPGPCWAQAALVLAAPRAGLLMRPGTGRGVRKGPLCNWGPGSQAAMEPLAAQPCFPWAGALASFPLISALGSSRGGWTRAVTALAALWGPGAAGVWLRALSVPSTGGRTGTVLASSLPVVGPSAPAAPAVRELGQP